MSSVLSFSKATTLRTILAIALALILIGAGAGFYFGYLSLKEVAAQSSEVQATAYQSDQRLQELLNMEMALNKNTEAIKNAERIVAESQSYMYQNQIINDITAFANQSELALKSISFSSMGGEESSSPSQETSAPAMSGIKSTTIAIELGGNISYLSILRFVHLIEQNLTRMQISNLSFTGSSADQEGEGESSQTLNIEVFVR